jgi:uncharacterized membrane protein (Fun14 family)
LNPRLPGYEPGALGHAELRAPATIYRNPQINKASTNRSTLKEQTDRDRIEPNMSLPIWEPVIYIFAQGGLAGMVIGFAVRKLNKAIAAAVGLLFLVVNVLWIARMMEIDLAIPQLNALIDNLMALLPFTPQELIETYGPNLGTLTSLPFIGGLLVGIWIGFKLA